jgi:hypothetical protein
LITGAADDDPSGIAAYSQVGAEFGFAMLWTMLFSFPLMAAIQEICARLGRITGVGITPHPGIVLVCGCEWCSGGPAYVSNHVDVREFRNRPTISSSFLSSNHELGRHRGNVHCVTLLYREHNLAALSLTQSTDFFF